MKFGNPACAPSPLEPWRPSHVSLSFPVLSSGKSMRLSIEHTLRRADHSGVFRSNAQLSLTACQEPLPAHLGPQTWQYMPEIYAEQVLILRDGWCPELDGNGSSAHFEPNSAPDLGENLALFPQAITLLYAT
eukprot:1140234-Pelagomonas_calceolata.AAC.1